MKHVVTTPTPPFSVLDGRLEVHQVPVWQDNLVWIAVCVKTGECAVVDGPEAGPVLDYIKAHGFRWTTILNTHTHPDHIGINLDLQRRGMLASMRVFGPSSRPDDVPGITDPVGDGSTFTFGKISGDVLLTEGHINGHISYVAGDALFCGDTMFGAGCGYLFDGPPAKMHTSLQRLAKLPGTTRVCCAHEYTQDNLRFAWTVEPNNPDLAARIQKVWAIRAKGGCTVPSTIAEELATNPFVRSESAELFAAKRAAKDAKHYRKLSDEALQLPLRQKAD